MKKTLFILPLVVSSLAMMTACDSEKSEKKAALEKSADAKEEQAKAVKDKAEADAHAVKAEGAAEAKAMKKDADAVRDQKPNQ